jgi:CHRD domain-containing protein
MKKHFRNVSMVIGSLLALSIFPASAHNGTKLHARMVPSQEVPAVSSLASGEFEARIESDSLISFKMSYEGLEGGPILFAHIHLGQRSVNGGVMAFLCNNTPTGPQPRACPAGPATLEGTITPADILPLATQQVAAGAFEEFVRALRNGTAYANLHTTASPGGEIRGQIRVDNGRHRGHDDDDHGHDH